MTDIVFGEDLSSEISRVISGAAMIVTDENIKRLYGEFAANVFIIPSGEKGKTPDVLTSILSEAVRRNINRDGYIVALGGGSVGDVTGLAASLYMRGIDWVSVPTTLLAMVDAGIGGKTAVDMCGIKNAIGTFHAPVKSIISYRFTKTLDENNLVCGYGEVIKTCLLSSRAFSLLKAHGDLRNGDICELIKECIDIKNTVTTVDPREKNLRKILNVGHTVGHALESSDGYMLTHGEYVLKGIMAELAMFGEYADKAFADCVINLCEKFTSPPKTSSRLVTEYALHDKKNKGGDITVMLPVSPGDVYELRLSPTEFASRYDRALSVLKKR